jgi:hypothetical protein
MKAKRRIQVPPHAGWPVEIVLSAEGRAAARFIDGREESFVFESELLERYGWSWDDVKAWAELGETGEAPLAWAEG